MTENTKIQNPQYIDLEKTMVSFQIVKEDGTILNAQLKVPENKERGVNAYWDRIMDEFDIEVMRKQRNDLEVRRRREREVNGKKQKAAIENEKLRHLFSLKIKAFEYPFIASAPDDIKAAIRRASSVEFLNMVLNSQIERFMKENNMSYVDYLDYLEDLEEEKEKNKK